MSLHSENCWGAKRNTSACLHLKNKDWIPLYSEFLKYKRYRITMKTHGKNTFLFQAVQVLALKYTVLFSFLTSRPLRISFSVDIQ